MKKLSFFFSSGVYATLLAVFLGLAASPVFAQTHSAVSNPGPVDNRTVPSAPTAVSAVGGIEHAVVTFSAPSDDGGASVSGYTVTASPGGATGSGATSPITISGLAPGSYTFTVTASNALGVSPASSASSEVTVSATPPATMTHSGVSDSGPVDNRTVPSAPTGVAAVGGIDQAVVTFAAPSDDGGASVSGYTVTASPGGATGSGTASPITISGLAPGPYTFTVTASNALGVGPASSASSEVTVSATPPATMTHSAVSDSGPVDNRTVPSAPTGVAAVGGIDQAVVTFAAPSDDGGASVSGYTVTASPGGATGSGATSPITISGLAPGPYTFTVTASNALGVGPASSASLEVTVSATLPPTQGGVSNTGPTVSAPGSFTVTEDVAGNLTYTGTPFADADTASLTVTLSVADGAITGSAGTGITVSGTATARTFAGTVSDLNAYFTTAGKITYQGNGVQFSVSF